jgi:hypothetical protein
LRDGAETQCEIITTHGAPDTFMGKAKSLSYGISTKTTFPALIYPRNANFMIAKIRHLHITITLRL